MSNDVTKVEYRKVDEVQGTSVYEVVSHYHNGDVSVELATDDTMGDIEWACSGRKIPFVKMK